MPPTRSRRLRPAAAAAALALVTATGCFTGEPAPGEGRIRLALAFPPVAAMSPYSDDAGLLTRLGVGEPLVALDPGGAPRPLLATQWRRTGETTWELALRDDVVFHDGTPLTAEHAAAALTHAAEARPAPRALAGEELTATAVGEHTVRIETAEPDPVLVQRLSSPELVVLAPAAYREDAGAPDPVGTGTGPYVLRRVTGVSAATLEANPDHRDGPPAAPGLDVRFVPDAASRAGALRAGEVDVIDSVPISQLSAITEQHVLEVPLPRTVALYLNSHEGPFTDAPLRAAAAAAVDPERIVDAIYEGHADPARGMFGPASPWAADRPRPPAHADAADPGGERVTLATYSDRAELPEIASVVAGGLRDAGFTVEVVVREYSTIEADLLAGAFDAVIANRSYLLDVGDPVGYLAADWTCGGSYNLARFCDPDLDERIRAASEEPEAAERERAALETEAELLDRAVLVPISHERALLGVAAGVTGVAEDASERTLITAETSRS
ncbi:ABC transporter substrate-binding protein [Marinitenerispora sediminis]|uniref:ABC transporter substrate-binding protein n=1 Tax=Marinitenerispora sediminis TaxID=1931232 RepID=A0A368SYV2_9ACTN|nr:ABC transporter substrate-binding protein [Marinitenerispora sediminis]RCV47777.1 ABC transporter substrate-binding protein [Marinitenerispora sediminis]RCV48371.1 ABC transporter substrate-binding protein [Marinitenerispora sediminis]RCV50107.1 ABC transporter substrate-binding protein [Marinitenerispora sediminis]